MRPAMIACASVNQAHTDGTAPTASQFLYCAVIIAGGASGGCNMRLSLTMGGHATRVFPQASVTMAMTTLCWPHVNPPNRRGLGDRNPPRWVRALESQRSLSRVTPAAMSPTAFYQGWQSPPVGHCARTLARCRGCCACWPVLPV